MTEDDPELERAICDFQAGHRPDGSFRLIYETFFPAVSGFFARKGFSPDDCLELTQDVFLGTYTGLRGYEHRGRFGGWIREIARNVYLKRIRRRHTLKHGGTEVAIEESADGSEAGIDPRLRSSPDQEERLYDRERRRAFEAASRKLPERQLQCLVLRMNGCKYQEIAEDLKIDADTVKSHLHRAKKTLKSLLEDFDVKGEELGAHRS